MDSELKKSVEAYVDAWSEKMIEIWTEKIERLRAVRSGALHESLDDKISHVASGEEISLKFLEYGLAVEYGVGNGYSHDNGGDLLILDPEYRRVNGLDRRRRAGPRSAPYRSSGKPRVRKPWFNARYFASLRAMTNDLARIFGEEAANAVVANISSNIRSADQ